MCISVQCLPGWCLVGSVCVLVYSVYLVGVWLGQCVY